MLIEFAVSVAVLWLIVAASLDLARAFAASHILQSAARDAARKLALDDESAWDASFRTALPAIYDEDYLVVDANCLAADAATSGVSLEEEFRAKVGNERTLNRMLWSLMISDRVTIDGRDWNLLRYPGALLRASEDPSETQGKKCATPFRVAVPFINDAQSQIVLHDVVEEDPSAEFSLGSTSENAGIVGLKIWYPFQAAALSSWRIDADGFNRAVPSDEADDYSVVRDEDEDGVRVEGTVLSQLDRRGVDGELQAYATNQAGAAIPVYAGSMGLGVQGILGREVRPFRRVISAQAFAPREVIGAGSGT